MSTGSKIASAIPKLRMLLPIATWSAAHHGTKLQLMMYQTTLFRCFQPTRRKKNLLQPLKPTGCHKHQIKTQCATPHHKSDNMWFTPQLQKFPASWTTEEKINEKTERYGKKPTKNMGEETVERQDKKEKKKHGKNKQETETNTQNCRERLSRCDAQTQQQTTRHRTTKQNNISEHDDVLTRLNVSQHALHCKRRIDTINWREIWDTWSKIGWCTISNTLATKTPNGFGYVDKI